MVVIARTTLCSLLSLSVITGAVALPTTAAASSIQAVALVAGTHTAAPASVLGLDAEDNAAGKALTQALRKAFATRGMSGGDELSFAEVKLTMGCEGDDPKCLAQAGETLGVDHLIYGYLRKEGGGNFRVEVYVLDVATADVEAETTAPVSAADLSSDRIDRTATEIVNSLFPEEGDGELPAPVPPIGSELEGTDKPTTRDKPKRESNYVWGRYKPRPAWKWAGLGVGIGLTVGGIVVAAIGQSKIRQPGGPLERELYREAEESLTDLNRESPEWVEANGLDHPAANELNTANDIDPAEGGDLCGRAEVTPPGAEDPETVTNSDVAGVCRKIDGWTAGTTAAAVAAVVGGVLTITFTTLLFVHKAGPKSNARARAKHERRGRWLRFDAGPSRGGVVVTGSGRF